jgi:RNA polymerase sigma factor (sigma-70 family)
MGTPIAKAGTVVNSDDVGALVRAAAGGDAWAWKSIVERFGGLVWSVARAHGLAHADAQEVFQTTWLRLTEHIGRISEPDRVGGWLATTARHESLRLLRLGSRVAPTGDPDVLDAGVPVDSPEATVIAAEDASLQAERARVVWAAFAELSGRCRELLRVLVASPPPSYAEVAAALGMPIGSIGPTRARCLQQLRLLVAGRDITSPTASA